MYGVHVYISTDHDILHLMLSKKEDNLRQRRLLKVLKDYDKSILYHSGTTNVVVDALRLLSMKINSYIEEEKRELVKHMHRLAHFGVRLMDSTEGGLVVINEVE